MTEWGWKIMCECISFILDREEVHLQTFISPNNLLSCMLVGMITEIDCTLPKIGAKVSMISSQRSYISMVSDERKKYSSLKEEKTIILYKNQHVLYNFMQNTIFKQSKSRFIFPEQNTVGTKCTDDIRMGAVSTTHFFLNMRFQICLIPLAWA